MNPTMLRALARHLEHRPCAPSLKGYGLVDGLRAAADLLDNDPGPIVHVDGNMNDRWPRRICTLRELVESLDLDCPHPEVDVQHVDDETGVCSSCCKVVPV